MPSLSVKKATVTSPKRSKTVPPHFMEDALAFFFAIVEPEIVQIHPTYISPTVEEFVYGFKKLNKTFAGELSFKSATLTKESKRRQTRRNTKRMLPTLTKPRNGSNQVGGTLSENMQILFSFILGNAIGTFDTPCAMLFSFIAIMLYALWGYKLVSDKLPEPLPGANPALMASDPATAITDVVVEFTRRHVPVLNAGLTQFENRLQEYCRRTLANYEAEPTRRRGAEHMFASSIVPVLKKIVNIKAYKLYIVMPLACGLAAIGIPSCWRECTAVLPSQGLADLGTQHEL